MFDAHLLVYSRYDFCFRSPLTERSHKQILIHSTLFVSLSETSHYPFSVGILKHKKSQTDDGTDETHTNPFRPSVITPLLNAIGFKSIDNVHDNMGNASSIVSSVDSKPIKRERKVTAIMNRVVRPTRGTKQLPEPEIYSNLQASVEMELSTAPNVVSNAVGNVAGKLESKLETVSKQISKRKSALSSRYLLHSKTTIHTKTTTLALALLNPTHEIRKCFSLDKKKSAINIPDAKIVVGKLGDDKIIIKSYRLGVTSNKLLYEFFHMYLTIKLGDNNILVAFCTIDRKELPLEEDERNNKKETDITDDFSIVPGWKEIGNYQLKTGKYDQSLLTLNFLIDISPSHLSPSLLLSYLKKNANILETARSVFERNDEIDEMVRNSLRQRFSNPTANALTPGEDALIAKSLTYANLPFVRIPGTLKKDTSVEMFHILSSEEAAWGKGVGIIDTSAVNCLAWYYDFCSNERMTDHVKSGDVLRVAHEIPNSHSMVTSGVKVLPKGVAYNRVFHFWLIWNKIPNYNGHVTYVLAFAPRELCDSVLLPPPPSFPNQDSTIVGKSSGVYIFEVLAPQVTRMTLIQQAELGGKIPLFLMNMLIKSRLSGVQKSVNAFKRKGDQVDEELRREFIAKIPSAPTLTPGQQSLVDRCMLLESTTADEFMEIESTSHRIKYFQKHETSGATKTIAIGKATTEIDASAEEILGWRWDWCSNEKMLLHREDSKSMSRSVVKEISINDAVVSTI